MWLAVPFWLALRVADACFLFVGLDDFRAVRASGFHLRRSSWRKLVTLSGSSSPRAFDQREFEPAGYRLSLQSGGEVIFLAVDEAKKEHFQLQAGATMTGEYKISERFTPLAYEVTQVKLQLASYRSPTEMAKERAKSAPPTDGGS